MAQLTKLPKIMALTQKYVGLAFRSVQKLGYNMFLKSDQEEKHGMSFTAFFDGSCDQYYRSAPECFTSQCQTAGSIHA